MRQVTSHTPHLPDLKASSHTQLCTTLTDLLMCYVAMKVYENGIKKCKSKKSNKLTFLVFLVQCLVTEF